MPSSVPLQQPATFLGPQLGPVGLTFPPASHPTCTDTVLSWTRYLDSLGPLTNLRGHLWRGPAPGLGTPVPPELRLGPALGSWDVSESKVDTK